MARGDTRVEAGQGAGGGEQLEGYCRDPVRDVVVSGQ